MEIEMKHNTILHFGYIKPATRYIGARFSIDILTFWYNQLYLSIKMQAFDMILNWWTEFLELVDELIIK